MYSNIFFGIGSFFNERFLFIGVLGMALLSGFFLVKLALKMRIAGVVLSLLMFLSFLLISWDRISDWESDEILVLNDVQVSTGSARANLLAAEASLNLYKKERNQKRLLVAGFENYLEQGVFYGERALDIYPEYSAPLDILGNIYFEQGQVNKSFDLFLSYYRGKPEERVKENLLFISKTEAERGDLLSAIHHYKKLLTIFNNGADQAQVYEQLGKIYGSQLNQLDSSIYFTQLAIQLSPQQANLYENLGTAYAIKGRVDQAQHNFLKALDLGVKSKQLYINIGLTYRQQGNETLAKTYLAKAENGNGGNIN